MNRAALAALGVAVGVAVWLASRRKDGADGVSDIEQSFSDGLEYVGGVVEEAADGLTLALDRSFNSINWNNAGKVPDDLRYNRQIMAFMRVIREGESSQGPEAYYMMNGGELMADLSRHPNRIGRGGTSTAAGAYQIVFKTWDAIRKMRGLSEEFSPVNQERVALGVLAYVGAVNHVMAGRLRDAFAAASKDAGWTSLPGGREHPQTYAGARAVFVKYGGIVAAGH